MPKPALSITSQTTGRSASIAVATTDGLALKPPSPTSDTAARSGCAIFTPSTAAGPNPIVARPLGVMNVPGTVIGNCWRDAVLVPADVGDDEAVFGHALCAARSECAPDASETDSSSTDDPSSRRTPGGRAAMSSRRRPRSRCFTPARRGRERAERQLRVGDDAELGLDSCARFPRRRHRCGSAASAESRT